MKPCKAAVYAVLVLALTLLFSCTNPYMAHNLERPVYLTGIEIRSDILTAEEPAHSLDQMFQETRNSYTVTVPFNAKKIFVNGIPEAGAWVAGDTVRQFDTGQDETSFTLTVNKEHRRSVTYTVRVLRGLPIAELQGLELYISDQIARPVPPDPSQPVDADDFEQYEHDNYIINFVPKQDTYEVTVPFHASHLTIVSRSYINPENRVERISYEFKDFEGNTIGPDGVSRGSFVWNKNCNSYTMSPVMPSWYTPGNGYTPLEWGDLQVYPGLSEGTPVWFGKDTIVPLDPDPRGKGKAASITVTVSSGTLSDKVYTIKLLRESSAAYLDKLVVTSIAGAAVPAPPPGTPVLPETDGTGVPDPSGTNRLIGNFARTLLNYDAAIPNSANAFTITPMPDWHITPVKYTYTTYYYDVEGSRWFIDSGGVHRRSTILVEPEDDYEAYKLADRTGPVNLYYDTDKGEFMKYVRMEVYVTVKSAIAAARTYRVTVRRQKDAAVLNGISVEPYAPPPTDGYPDGNVFTQAVTGNPDFNPQVVSYTVEVNAGRTRAKLVLDNDGGSLSGSVNRVIRVIGPDGLVKEFRGGKGAWRDEGSVFVSSLVAEVELKNRSTQVRIQIEDNPAYAPREYVINLLSKNQNDIILPVDADNDGVVRAVFAGGSNDGLTAERALPGEKIRLTISANLGYYIDWSNYGGSGDHSSPLAGDKYHGVSVYASTLVMGDGNDKVHYVESPGAHPWKIRVYEFNMPDENVTFTVKYRPTVAAVEKIAYVAEGALRGGGYGTGSDNQTATSWGRASNDLQAVINSWNGPGHFSEIWVLRGTYTPPDPDTYVYESAFGASNCFPAGSLPHSAADYRVNSYTFTGIGGKEDISFVLRPGIQIYGGFEETDDNRDRRSTDAATKTILNGEFADGTRAHHVVLAVDAPGTVLDTLTITGGIGPEAASSITVKHSAGSSRTVSRQTGGGLCNINSNIELSNVIIRNNKSTNGGGMYNVSVLDILPELKNVEFYSNTALESGGGMYNTVLSGKCEPRISDSLFRENKSVNRGGGLYNGNQGCQPVILNSRFVSNSAKDGGGIFNNGGASLFQNIIVEENWTSGNGSGIYNGSKSTFFNINVRRNESKGGSGIGIFNAGILEMTNAAIVDNKLVAGGPQGGGLYNGGTASLSNTTISGNTAANGGGIHNRGNLIMANVVINGNEASYGGGLTNQDVEDGSAAAMLTNVTLAGNTSTYGGGIYNDYEGSAEAAGAKNGSINLILTNVRITGNSGNGIYNNYWRFGGTGINLTLNNTTIAGNEGYGVRSHKDTGHAHFTFAQDEENPAVAVNRKSFPVRVRFLNTVVWGNSLDASYWSVGSSPVTPNPGESRETYDYSLLQGMAPGGTNPDGKIAYTGLFASPLAPDIDTGGDYRPGSGSGALVNAGGADLYPTTFGNLVSQLFWKIGGDGGIAGYSALLFYTAGNEIGYKQMDYFLGYDNSFNKGDLRPGMNEGNKTKTRPGALDIGAYER
ncbi:MAG: right-handed parallel beta-helix repeat-containing protein [Treponema sp.]|jgi:hypothetical protein|nr:right-handed parallel beta-helix repeat-containing protein [Treponema sp.]